MQQSMTTPTGSRQPARLTSTRPTRGGIQKKGGTQAIHVDKDGDWIMDAAASGRAAHPARSGRGTAVRGSALRDRQGTPDSFSKRVSSRPKKNVIDPAAIQKAVLRGMGSNEPLPRGAKTRLNGTRSRDIAREVRDGLERLQVLGLKQSKAASNKDGGVSDLIAFIERKATHPEAPASESVKIKKSRMEGEALIIFVRAEDKSKVLRINGFTFAGSPLNIEGPSKIHAPLESNADSETPNTIEVLKAVLSRRYSIEAKLLDLSQIGSDPELLNIGMFNSTSRESKFFPALMKICNDLFKSEREKEEAVVSVSLANNGLPNITSVTTLAQTFPGIKNLDLSGNLFPDLKALQGWRWKFRKLELLILSGNPIEAKQPQYQDDIIKWYPTLTSLNHVQVRPMEEAKATTSNKHPLPIQGGFFQDQQSICENFLKQFFLRYDSDRIGLINQFYDDESTFSLSINTSAPRAADYSINHSAATWDQYIKRSRNLTKITNPSTRSTRIYTGTDAIRGCFITLPATRHPDMVDEPQKRCVECITIPGLPDPTGQSPGGVVGFMINVHGEFVELDFSTDRSTVTRSFDRTFVVGPGTAQGSVRIVNDTLVLRAYGGHEAWKPEGSEIALDTLLIPSQPAIQDQERLALELSRETGMTLQYSAMCLESNQWNLQEANMHFRNMKGQLPSDAFLQQL